MKKQVLLTGGSGFVGRQVLKALLARGDCAVRVVTRNPDAFAGQLVDCVASTDLFAESVDRLADICRDIDTVIHAAWYVEQGKFFLSERNLGCLRGTVALGEAAIRAGVRRFVGIGTCLEYRLEDRPLTPETLLRPESPYAAAKAAAWLALNQTLPLAGVEFAWCRLFYLHGEGESEGRLVPSLRRQLAAGEPVKLTHGVQVRDFLDVAEAGARIAGIALSGFAGGANICSGVPITVRALAEQIADEYGRRDLLQFGARAENAVDPPYVVGVPTLIPDF